VKIRSCKERYSVFNRSIIIIQAVLKKILKNLYLKMNQRMKPVIRNIKFRVSAEENLSDNKGKLQAKTHESS